ncbi:uncharacterized protein [Lepeophtheirus salmonis]|uniref:uncharacterized protein n=1 Tax=Lepeophtheirus salmonis TaxID=72036 RepID=UPI001AEB5536|nr:uncharacterized protein LOC121117936 [Lepeophtheirus salmonis]
MRLQVVPWYSESEWISVRNQILSSSKTNWEEAKARIYCWKARVERLPAGVETTLCLLQAKLSPASPEMDPSIRLTLSAAVIRFLNHLSHIGKHRYNCDTFDEAVIKLGIPNWLIGLRHEATHGSMTNMDLLCSGLDFCWNWICINYWSSDPDVIDSDLNEEEDNNEMQVEGDSEEEDESDERLSPALECYFYLSIYKIWKTKRVDALKDQPELFDHLQSLWNKATTTLQEGRSSKKRRKKEIFQNLFIKEAINVMRIVIFDAAGKDINKFIDILLSEHLLFPQLDILRSLLKENQLDKSIVLYQDLPPSLIEIWNEAIKFISDNKMLSDLFMCLVKNLDGVTDVPRYIRAMSCGWILEIARSIVPSENGHESLKLPFPEYFNDFVSHCVLFPNEFSQYYIETVFQLRNPRWTPEKEVQVLKMIEAYHNTSVELEDDYVPKFTVAEFDDSKWKPAEEINWSEYPLGHMFGREFEFHVPLDVRKKLALNVEDFPPSTIFEFGKVNWVNNSIEYVSLESTNHVRSDTPSSL